MLVQFPIMDFNAGAVLGGYRLVDRIGAGGMGEVWKAEDVRLGRTVAIKILPASLESDSAAKLRLEREARTAAQLYHANIATIHAMHEEGGRSFIVMEYVDGEPLSRVISRGRVAESEARRIAREVADALAAAHARGIVHRDIKPDNIMLSGDRVKVLDFGIAKQIGPAALDVQTPSTLTQKGMILGTVQYMSPEQALGRPLDARSDIFSLGVVLYQMLCGALPFSGETVTEMLTQIVRDEPADLAARVPGLSSSTLAIVRRSLQKKREDRFASAADLRDALASTVSAASAEQFIATEALTAVRPQLAPTVVERSPRRGVSALIIAVIAVVAVLGGAAFWYSTRKNEAPRVAAAQPATPSTAIEVTAPPPSSTIVESTAPPAPATTTVTTSSATQNAVSTPTAPRKVEIAPTSTAPPVSREAFERGMRQFLASEWSHALTSFTAALENDPTDAAAELRVAEIQMIHGNRLNAQSHYANVVAAEDRLDARERKLAAIGSAFVNGEPARAEELVREFDAQYPGDAELALMRDAGNNTIARRHDGAVPKIFRPRSGPRHGRRF